MSGVSEKMIAAVYRDGAFTVKELPMPRPGAGEALLKVEAAALCATDIKIWRSGHRNILPGSDAVLGHEVVGWVEKVGLGVDTALIGKRVVIPPNVGCGLCPVCRSGRDSYCLQYKAYGVGLQGGLAGYMLLTASSVLRGNLIEVPGHVPDKMAVLAEPASCCYRGLSDCRLEPGETVLVMGAGPMGIISVILARAMGASMIIAADPLEARRKSSLKFQADHALDPQAADFNAALQELTGELGVDVVMVTAPFAGAQLQGIEAAAIGGRVNLFAGLSPDDRFDHFPANLVHYRGLKVLGSTGTTPVEMGAVVRLMAGGRLEQLQDVVTSVYPLTKIEKALEDAGQGGGLKVVLLPDGNEK